jgi:hypothetical protein
VKSASNLQACLLTYTGKVVIMTFRGCRREETKMHVIYMIALVLLALWAVGVVLKIGAGIIHLLLLIAVILVVYRLITGRRAI